MTKEGWGWGGCAWYAIWGKAPSNKTSENVCQHMLPSLTGIFVYKKYIHTSKCLIFVQRRLLPRFTFEFQVSFPFKCTYKNWIDNYKLINLHPNIFPNPKVTGCVSINASMQNSKI